MMVIEACQFKRSNRYIWLKKVTGVDLTKHCARCLLGEYHPLFGKQLKSAVGLKLKGGETPYYICTVDGTYTHHFHLAFREKQGAVIDIDCPEARVLIRDAEALPIDARNIDPADQHIGDKAYSTCRNWWFAHWYAKEIRGRNG